MAALYWFKFALLIDQLTDEELLEVPGIRIMDLRVIRKSIKLLKGDCR